MLNEILIAIICSLFFYILGSFPTSYLLGKKLYKIDILDKDSRHSGLSNIYNLIPKKYILLIFCRLYSFNFSIQNYCLF